MADPIASRGSPRGSPRGSHPPRAYVIALAIVWLIAAALIIAKIDRGWVPHDEGTIAHAAERVLAGELPHRDFDEVYTGGMSFLHAAAMRVFGVTLVVPRAVLVTAFLLCIPVLFYAATRFTGAIGAAVTTLGAVVWSVPNYTAALPSWYNLIFAVGGVGALLRYLDTQRRRWLVVAGVLAGLSFLMKVVGLYFVAAVLLFLLYLEQETGAAAPKTAEPDAGERRANEGVGYAAFVGAGLIAFLAGLIAVVGLEGQVDFTLHFVVPGGALAIALLANERRVHETRGTSAGRFRTLFRLAGPFVLGVLVPVALFLAPYAATGALGDFARGVFVTPFQRLTSAVMAPLPWTYITPTLGVVLLLLAARRHSKEAAIALAAGAAIIGGVLVATADGSAGSYRTLFHAAVLLPPVAVVAAAVVIARGARGSSERRQRLMLVAAVAAMFALVQFPFAAPIYFCYTTPLVALLAVALIGELELPSPATPAALAAVLIAFAVLRVNPGFINNIGSRYWQLDDLAPLASARGEGIRVPAPTALAYDRLVGFVQERERRDDGYIYAAPDVPEVYFLAGRRNPTRTLFDFFDDPEQRTERILHALKERDVRVVAINHYPDFSGPMPPALRAALVREYPEVAAIGKFEVRWRQ